jgi:glycosyltransferase involved in cell wall biosynthesis
VNAPRIVLSKKPATGVIERADAGLEPMPEYVDLSRRIGASIISFHDLGATRRDRITARAAGPAVALAMLVDRMEPSFVYVTAEDVALPLGLLARLRRRHGQIVTVVHQVDTVKRRRLFRAIGHRPFRAVIVLSTRQHDIFVNELGFPASKVHTLANWIDTAWFCPGPIDHALLAREGLSEGMYALSVGMESRDYPTLVAAMGLVGDGMHSHIVGSGWSTGSGYSSAEGVTTASNVTTGTGYSADELRSLYRGARFVVVPVKRVTYAAGVTGVGEGMACAKAVIVSESPGIGDYTRGGALGGVVPCGDPAALRDAITVMWHHESRDEIGAANRAWIADLDTRRYAERVAAICDFGTPAS